MTNTTTTQTTTIGPRAMTADACLEKKLDQNFSNTNVQELSRAIHKRIKDLAATRPEVLPLVQKMLERLGLEPSKRPVPRPITKPAVTQLSTQLAKTPVQLLNTQ